MTTGVAAKTGNPEPHANNARGTEGRVVPKAGMTSPRPKIWFYLQTTR